MELSGLEVLTAQDSYDVLSLQLQESTVDPAAAASGIHLCSSEDRHTCLSLQGNSVSRVGIILWAWHPELSVVQHDTAGSWLSLPMVQCHGIAAVVRSLLMFSMFTTALFC